MSQLEFYIVDVFAECRYAGNQLAVFRNSGDLPLPTMQAIARETNFSETTFIRSDKSRDGGFDVRIFTPHAEIPFAGHPTLGTAFVIKEHILKSDIEQVKLNLSVGQIPVDFHYHNGKLNFLWMQQNQPVFGPQLPREEVMEILSLEPGDFEADFPIEEITTGIPFFIVPLRSMTAVKKARVRLDKYDEFVKRYNPNLSSVDKDNVISSGFFVFCKDAEEPENDLHARMFDPYYDVPEDPATGSANGCFLSYLLKHRYFDRGDLNLRVEQGYEIGRPSLLRLKGRIAANNRYEIFVGGQVQSVAKGDWYV